MYSGELETNEFFNPVPIFSNSTGDIPRDDARQGKQIMPDNDGVAMQTLYDNPAPCSGYQQARKKKAEDGLMEEGLLKYPLVEQGESSGNDSNKDHVRGAVGPNPPAPP